MLRKRIQETSEFANDLELQIAEIKTESGEAMVQNATEQQSKEKILDAKVPYKIAFCNVICYRKNAHCCYRLIVNVSKYSNIFCI